MEKLGVGDDEQCSTKIEKENLISWLSVGEERENGLMGSWWKEVWGVRGVCWVIRNQLSLSNPHLS